MEEYRIKPIDLGRIRIINKAQVTYLQGAGDRCDVALIMWYLESNNKKIVVDTGPSEPGMAEKYHNYLIKQFRTPSEALKKEKINPLDIDYVIITHLHWDHCYNNYLFKNAKFFVQREELRYAIAPLPVHAIHYEAISLGMTPPYINTCFEILDGDFRLDDRINIIFTPGHTPGSQGISIKTDKGTYFIAGDNVPLYENWKGNSVVNHIPNGVFVNLEQYFKSLNKIENLGAFVVPGHDPLVFDKESYP